MAVIEQRGRGYRARVRIKGFPPQSAAFERLTDARRWAQQTEAAIREGRHFKTSEAKRHTAGELIDRYIRDVIPQKKRNSQGTQKKAAEAIAKKVDANEKRLEKAAAELAERVGEEARKQKGRTIEERVLGAAKRMAEAREHFETATEGHRTAELTQQRVKHEYSQIDAKVTACKERVDEIGRQIQQVDKEIAGLMAQIKKVSTDPDPLGERKRLAAEIVELERNLKAAQMGESKTNSAMATAVEGARQAANNAGMAQDAAEKARRKAHEAALEAGFPDAIVAVQAAIPAAERHGLQASVDHFKRDRDVLEKRLSDLEADLGTDLVGAEAFREAETRVAEERRKYEEAIRVEASLKTTVDDLQRRLETAERLSTELKTVKVEHRIYKQLADDLRSERFQAYLLDEAFRELVNGASVRLMELSGRYTFDYRDDAFFVLDHNNAQEQRSTDTLSGGETFLASLALALELSQQVQRAAGAVNLDSLFIDEGFGTLDAETLDTVASAIESLRVGGRMVGIITHIPELTARLPERITIEKRSEGSRVAVEID